MASQVEARYLMIDWQSKGVARDIKVAPHALEIERDADGGLSVESTIFNDFHPWLGIRLEPELGNAVPVFVTSSGSEIPMTRIADRKDGGHWWLQDDGWDPLKGRHFSELQRSAGAYNIRLGELTLRIENRLSNFGTADIQAYIDDFRGDLIWMIINDAAAATASGQTTGVGAELIAALKALRVAACKVLASPAVNIREAQAPQLVSKLRPNITTFREYLRNPAARHFTGRVFNESADTAENRYVRHMLGSAHKIAAAYISAATLQAEFLERLASREAERAERDNAMTSRRVDPQVYDHQTQEIARRLDGLTSLNRSPANVPERLIQFPIRLGKRYSDKCAFFYYRQDGQETPVKDEIAYRIVVLPEDAFDVILAAHHVCKDLTLTGSAMSSVKQSSNGKQYRELKFIAVNGISAQTQVLERRAAKRKRLEEHDWHVALSTNERRELKREAATAERRSKRSQEKKIAISSSAQDIAREVALLLKTNDSLARLGVSTSSLFPRGMRLVSNPDYAACVSAFGEIRRLIERGGLDLSRLEEINNIGILHASDIYEKWCLLKILMLLMHDFRFEPEAGWEDKLITATLARSDNVKFECSREDLKIKASLTWQAQMSSGRRPDFVIDITDADDEEPKRYNLQKGRRIGLVMDAKFRSKWKKDELHHLLDELTVTKGYDQAQDDCRVFILQPCAHTVRPAKSPLQWGAHCDYSRTRAHRQGWVQAGFTSSDAHPTQHLKRLLALAFQSAFLPPVQLCAGKDDNVWTSRSFCIGCGERHESQSIQSKRTKSGATRWLLDCRHCGVWTTRTHCYSCPTPLFKNGTVWTYHDTIADQVTNVICPGCGCYFEEDFLSLA